MLRGLLLFCRALAGRRGAELAPWKVAAGNLISVYHGLKLSKQQAGCADRWAQFVRANVTGAFLAANTQFALNSSQTLSPEAQPDVQGRLLRTLLLGLAAEFGDPSVQIQALALFAVRIVSQHDADADMWHRLSFAIWTSTTAGTQDRIWPVSCPTHTPESG